MSDARENKHHPVQPLANDETGIMRFKRNEIVQRLLDEGAIDLNKIATWDVSDEDRQQFAQLIGYSLGGYGELSYVTNEAYATAAAVSEGQDVRDARIAALEETLASARQGMREGVATLYGMHPGDLPTAPQGDGNG